MKNNFPEWRKDWKNGTDLMGTIDTYLIYRLTKGSLCDDVIPNASRTLFMKSMRLYWDRDLIEFLALMLNELPKIQESASYS
jgi:glycerol kinase